MEDGRMSKTGELAWAMESLQDYCDELNEILHPEGVRIFLTGIRPFFADRADVTGEADDPMAPNAEMQVLDAIDAALAHDPTQRRSA